MPLHRIIDRSEIQKRVTHIHTRAWSTAHMWFISISLRSRLVLHFYADGTCLRSLSRARARSRSRHRATAIKRVACDFLLFSATDVSCASAFASVTRSRLNRRDARALASSICEHRTRMIAPLQGCTSEDERRRMRADVTHKSRKCRRTAHTTKRFDVNNSGETESVASYHFVASTRPFSRSCVVCCSSPSSCVSFFLIFFFCFKCEWRVKIGKK